MYRRHRQAPESLVVKNGPKVTQPLKCASCDYQARVRYQDEEMEALLIHGKEVHANSLSAFTFWPDKKAK